MIILLYAIPSLCLWLVVSSGPIWSSGIFDSVLIVILVYMVMKRNDDREMNARDFGKHGGFMPWGKVGQDCVSKTKQEFLV